jgi:DNA-binding MarR family transcriptional regulator
MASSNKTNETAAVELAPAMVLRQFRIVFNAVKSHFRDVERVAGIGGAHLWALSVIEQAPGIGVTELAQALDVHQSTASNLVRSLVKRGLIVSSREGADRRTTALHLLDAGVDILRLAPAPFAGVLPEALAELAPETLARLHHDLGLLIAGLNADDESAQKPLAQL